MITDTAKLEMKAVDGEQPHTFYGFVRTSAKRESTEITHICAFFETDQLPETNQQRLYLDPKVFYFGKKNDIGRNSRGNLPADISLLISYSPNSQIIHAFASTPVYKMRLSTERLKLIDTAMLLAKRYLTERIIEMESIKITDNPNSTSRKKLADVPQEFREEVLRKGYFYHNRWNTFSKADLTLESIASENDVVIVPNSLGILPEWTKRYTLR